MTQQGTRTNAAKVTEPSTQTIFFPIDALSQGSEFVSGIPRVVERVGHELSKRVPVEFIRLRLAKQKIIRTTEAPNVTWSSRPVADEMPGSATRPRSVGAALRGLGRQMERRVRLALNPLRRVLNRRKWQQSKGFLRTGWFVDLGTSWHGPAWSQRFLREFSEQKRAVLVHDLTPLTLEIPQYAESFIRDYEDFIVNYVGSCDIVLYYSEATAQSLASYLRDRGRSVPPFYKIRLGSDSMPREPSRTRRSPAQSDPYILFVSSISPRKRHHLVLDVWEDLSLGGGAPPKLFVVGNPAPDRTGYGDSVIQRVQESEVLGRTVDVLGQVTDRELERLYRDCLALIFPSVAEGWGLPISEALAHGRVPIYLNQSAMAEAAQGLGIAIDEDSISGWGQAVRLVTANSDYRRRLEKEIDEKFVSFTWSDTAADIVAALAEAERQLALRPG